MSPSDWWYEERTVQVNFSKNMVTSSDTCSVIVTPAERPYHVLFVSPSCRRTRCGLLVVIVQWTCSASSFAITGCRVVQGLVNQSLLWSTRLPRSLKLTCNGPPEAFVSSPGQCGCWLIKPKSLIVECSTKGLGHPTLRYGCSDGTAFLA